MPTASPSLKSSEHHDALRASFDIRYWPPVTERLFILIGGLSSKVFAAVVTGTSGILGVLIGEVMTSQSGLAILSGALATAFAAVFLVIPRVMEQRRKSRESAAKLNSDSIALLMTAHDRDVAFFKDKIAALELTVALHVRAKHKAVNEWGAMTNGYNILAAQLRAHNLKPDLELESKTYADIVGDSDDEITAIAKDRVTKALPVHPAAEE